MSKDYLFHHRNSPILFSVPHDGGCIPSEISNKMHEYALDTPDRDYYVAQLFNFAKDLDISLLKTNISRYVIDMNRSPDNESLYPGQSVTELCPTTSFDDRDIYKYDIPDRDEVQARIEKYWQPFHQIISDKLSTIRQQHGYAILFDCHSIKSKVPRFFDGKLPDINIGTYDGASCSNDILKKFMSVLQSQNKYSFVLNGRFKGGYITRHYGQPDDNIHAIQIELSQTNYLNEANNRFDTVKAEQLKTVLIRAISQLC